MQRNPIRLLLILILSLCLVVLFSYLPAAHNRAETSGFGASPAAHGSAATTLAYTGSSQQIPSQTIFMPMVKQPDTFHQTPAIWAHTSSPAGHEVALFRRTFTVSGPVERAELRIFADTRYEVWLDGQWLGLGPARFSQSLREYDVYSLGALDGGTHLVAVLVQWAPNLRRSDSTRPMLQVQIHARLDESAAFHMESGPQWKSMLSDAWQAGAAPVHAWDLIGPTELLDLSRLPPDWNQPGFDDSQWGSAVVLSSAAMSYSFAPPAYLFYNGTALDEMQAAPQTGSASLDDAAVTYQPRSIQPLVHVPVSFDVIDGGLLSSEAHMVELTPPLTGTLGLNFRTVSPTNLYVEMLLQPPMLESTYVLLNDSSLNWQAAGDLRPDVYRANRFISPGEHRLTFGSLPEQGSAITLSSNPLVSLHIEELPFGQGPHAGMRLLLAEPESNWNYVQVTHGASPGITFERLPAYAVLDLGKTVHGRLTVEASGPAGSIVDIGWDERLLPDTLRPLPYPGSLHPQWNQVDSWQLDGAPRTLTTIDNRAGRYVLLAAWGSGSLELHDIRVVEERYPLTQSGSFQSSDRLLEQVWQTGVESLYANMTDAYTDTPWRERGQWWGDAYVEEKINRVSFGDTDLLRRGILFMADAFRAGGVPGAAPNSNGTVMLDFGMLWAHSLDEYVRLSGDRALLRKLFPVLGVLMERLAGYENADTGLLELAELPWWQSAYIETYGYHSRYGQSTALNALYYETLRRAAGLAGQVGDERSAGDWQTKAARVRQSVNELLYMPDEHRYATHLSAEGYYPPTVQAQAWALAYGLVPTGEVQEVVASMLELLSPDPSTPNASIYGMYWVLEALGRSGYIAEALQIIENYYGYLLDQGAPTWWERFNAIDDYTASLSHGWGGSPTWFLSSYLLGMQRTGEDTWLFRPALRGTASASGVLPLENGSVRASWQVLAGGNALLEVDADPQAAGEIVLPLPDPGRRVLVDGTVVWQDGGSSEIVYLYENELHFKVSGGQHALVIE